MHALVAHNTHDKQRWWEAVQRAQLRSMAQNDCGIRGEKGETSTPPLFLCTCQYGLKKLETDPPFPYPTTNYNQITIMYDV